jgi:PAS domain S-box-containing protein
VKFFSLGSITRNLAFLVIIAVLPALAILLYSGVEQRRKSIEEATRNIEVLTNGMAQVQNDLTRACRQMLSTLALLPEVQSLDIVASQKIFSAVLEENPIFHNIALVAADGEVLTAGDDYRQTNFSDRRHFQQALETQDFAAGNYIVTRLGKIVQAMPYAFPVLDNAGQTIAVLTTAINLERFSEFHSGGRLPQNSFIAAVDNQGIRLFYYPPTETNPVGRKISSASWKISQNAAEPGFFTRSGSDGTRRIFSFRPLRLSPDSEPYIYLWAGIPESAIVSPANQILIRNLVLMLCATGLALVIAWALGQKRLIQPLKQLLTMTQQFAAGRLEEQSDLAKQQDEFGTLALAFHDMATAIRMGQKALLQNEARFRTVMDSLDAIVYVADMESYEILFLNEFGKKMFGDVTGQICWEKLQQGQTGPCDFCTNDQLLNKNGQPGKIVTWEFQNTLTGQWFYIHDRAIKWIDGRIVRMEIATDISDRKQAEAKLAEETERLAITLASIGDGVISCDTAGCVTLTNQAAEKLTGWSADEAIGKPLSDVLKMVNEKSGKPIEDPVRKVLASGQIIGFSSSNLLISRTGIKRNISDSAAPIKDATGEIIGVVLVFRDITERLRTEQELIKVKKLESIGVLAGGIAHDFNNILAAILGNLDLSIRDTGISEKTRRRLKQARTASYRGRDLTQQLLTFAKGGQPIKETSSLIDVVKESAEFVLLGDKVACRYQFPDDLKLVDIDKGQISQVIQNIIINASNAMPEGGQIEITGQNIAAAEVDNPALMDAEYYVKLDFKDTGVGIPENLLDKIFDPYFTTKQQGSGLGLAITHSIISKHGGAISVVSSPGAGSTFSIYLPASLQASVENKQRIESQSTSQKARILVMDDEEIVRQIAAEMISEMGHDVLVATDGRQAVEHYRDAIDQEQPIDLLIMDLTIPGGMGGKEALEQILEIDETAKAIVSSGYSNDPIMANYTEYGFSAAIAKPYQLTDLNRVISQVLT